MQSTDGIKKPRDERGFLSQPLAVAAAKHYIRTSARADKFVSKEKQMSSGDGEPQNCFVFYCTTTVSLVDAGEIRFYSLEKLGGFLTFEVE